MLLIRPVQYALVSWVPYYCGGGGWGDVPQEKKRMGTARRKRAGNRLGVTQRDPTLNMCWTVGIPEKRTKQPKGDNNPHIGAAKEFQEPGMIARPGGGGEATGEGEGEQPRRRRRPVHRRRDNFTVVVLSGLQLSGHRTQMRRGVCCRCRLLRERVRFGVGVGVQVTLAALRGWRKMGILAMRLLPAGNRDRRNRLKPIPGAQTEQAQLTLTLVLQPPPTSIPRQGKAKTLPGTDYTSTLYYTKNPRNAMLCHDTRLSYQHVLLTLVHSVSLCLSLSTSISPPIPVTTDSLTA